MIDVLSDVLLAILLVYGTIAILFFTFVMVVEFKNLLREWRE